MAKGYWVVRMDVHDADKYASEYVPANAKPIADYGGRFLVRGGTHELIEGTMRDRTVVIEFPSYQAALDCMHSPAYQAAAEIRRKYGSGDVLVIEGYDGPQPGQ